ncbi:galactose-1-phosphate uridylyltransferase [Xylaria castorea]|nr:galactose-1-phosphate uridylyltransferase [Xylaria castorea]
MHARILNDIAHRRYNPLKDTWVMSVSPRKFKRPRQGQKEPISSGVKLPYDHKCYLCPGNARANGALNPTYAGSFLFENDFSTVRMDEGHYDTNTYQHKISSDMLRAEPVIGRCYVLVYSANHHYHVSDMTSLEVMGIVEVWASVYARHISTEGPPNMVMTHTDGHDSSCGEETCLENANLRYMQIFDNNGPIVGASNPHPHGQIWITSSIPDEASQELAQMSNYRMHHGGNHLLQDYARLEMDKKERIVYQNEAFLVVCPWWAVWPYEVLLLPKMHISRLVDLSDEKRFQLAEAILQVTKAFDNLFGVTFPYISGVHQAPLNATQAELDSSYLHMHFCPPLLFPNIKKFFGGCELFGEPTREIPPEVAAKHLRCSISQLSIDSVGRKSPDTQPQANTVLARPLNGENIGSEVISSWWRRVLRTLVQLK